MTKDEALKMAIEAMTLPNNLSFLMAITACKDALETPECNTHSKAPHGFNRNASHSAGRYVCECEGWQLEWQGLSDEEIDRIYCDVQDNCVKDFPSELYAAWIKAFKEKNS